MTVRFRPFDTSLENIRPEDLARLREVAEGWWVEYKSQLITPRAIAKSLSAFANHYGGWLFFGVAEAADGSHTAGSFLGISSSDIPAAIESIRNAAKDSVNPYVFYNVRVFDGPIPELGLAPGRALIAVETPSGPDPPYVHVDGRIYRRVADSSDPKAETDRFHLDQLSDRGRRNRARLKKFVTRTPRLSKSEGQHCFIHITIMSDPFEAKGHLFRGRFTRFSEIMKDRVPIPFDNIFTNPEGFVARQIEKNDPYLRTLTWEFSYRCHSFITYPLSLSSGGALKEFLQAYNYGAGFYSKLAAARLLEARVLDLNLLLDALAAFVLRHRALSHEAGVNGPFYCKAHLENTWRTIPFLDLPAYEAHVEHYGVPLIQHDGGLAPPGTELYTFDVLKERTKGEVTDLTGYLDAVVLALSILEALGIPLGYTHPHRAELAVAERVRALS